MLQSTGLQRVQHNRVAEHQQQSDLSHAEHTVHTGNFREKVRDRYESECKGKFLGQKKKKNPDLSSTNWARYNNRNK